MSDFVDAYCLQKSRFSVVLFQLHGCLQLIDYWSVANWQYKSTHFGCNHKCRLTMHALQKKYSSTSILAELSTEWQYWLTSLGSLKVLLMWNLLKLKLFRKLLSWTSQSCMAANSRCGSWCFLLSLSTANDLFHFLLPPLTLAFDISTFFSHQVAPKRTNVPGMKQPRGRGFNPYHGHPYMRPYGYSPYGYGWVVNCLFSFVASRLSETRRYWFRSSLF